MTRARQLLPDSAPAMTFGSTSTILTDVLSWLVATELAALARRDFNADLVPWAAVSIIALALAGGQLVVGGLVLLYRGRYVSGSFDEVRAVAVSATVVAAVATTGLLIAHPTGVGRSLAFLAWPMALAFMAAIRYVKRLIATAGRRPSGAEPLLIVGAGWLGGTLAQRMLQDPRSPFVPVGFLDDDPAKRNLRIHGVPVLGRLEDLPSAVDASGARRAVMAINNADADLIRGLYDAAEDAGIGCLVLPRLSDQLARSQLQLSR
ncbi:MAG: polysaccharide biosynthesis protein, partial [Jatrophihabitans sp.]